LQAGFRAALREDRELRERLSQLCDSWREKKIATGGGYGAGLEDARDEVIALLAQTVPSEGHNVNEAPP
jgi:hypothetical protein